MKNQVGNIVQKIMHIHVVVLSTFSAMKAKISHRNFVVVSTFMSFHQKKQKFVLLIV